MMAPARKATKVTPCESWFVRFLHFEKLIGFDIIQRLANAGGPENLHLCALCGSQAEMQALVARAQITSSRGGESCLTVDTHSSAVAVAIAARAAQRDGQPVLFSAFVYEDLRMVPQHAHHHILPSVVIEIAEG